MKIDAIASKILKIITMTDNEQLAFRLIIICSEINPCHFMTIFQACKLSQKLAEIGLSNSITMGSGWKESKWKLNENAISNYIICQRTQAIEELLS
ncbi:hypothetical protein [Flavobacterium sp. CAN_S2]|uniref:hypothetical protein n=1 Tax=Flavobacterium sp. CAN_S2 TaxID=2787726 RepID=UPI0018CA34F5